MNNVIPTKKNLVPAKKDISELTTRSLQFRTPLYHPRLPFVILWSQKAACTTVARWFFLQIGMLNSDMRKYLAVHSYEREFTRVPGYREGLLDAVRQGRPVIKFVRDPYARAYSSYLGICRKAAATGRYWGGIVRKQILNDLAGDINVPEYTFSFRQYLEWLARQDVSSLNPHVRPQYVPRDDCFEIRLCRIESLADHFAALEKEFKLPHCIADYSDLLEGTHFHKKSAAIDLDASRALLDLGVPLQRSAEFLHVKFSKETARGTVYEELVRTCFPEDVELYDY